jgi:L-arabinokinase
MNIAYYITSHGYGHGVRTCSICNKLPLNSRLILKTLLPEEFFRKEIMRPFEYVPDAFDCGCIQTDGVTVDIQRTINAYSAISEVNATLLDKEVLWCKANAIDVVIADIVPFAFDVAARAHIPSVAITNFSWYDIYAGYIAANPDFTPVLTTIQQQYSRATTLLALEPALPMPYFKHRIDIPPVGRIGNSIREYLCNSLGIDSKKHIGLIYTGTYGMDTMPWKNLERFSDWHFLGVYPLPGAPDNFTLLSEKMFRYHDVIASADVMISKIGYGVYSECLLNGLPLLYVPREDFAEYPVLEAGINRWGHGIGLSKTDFYALKWDDALAALVNTTKPERITSDGAQLCADAIMRLGR